MAQPLSPEEIQQRLVRLANLERLYADLQKKYRDLKAENDVLTATIAAQNELIEQLKLRIEELERMVFGRRKPKPPTDTMGSSESDHEQRRAPNRPSQSYRRPVPPEPEVTETTEHPLNSCPDCGTTLTKLLTVIRCIEDILPLSEWHKVLKRVTKLLITTGYCPCCGERKSAVPIPPQTVSLGANLPQFVSFATIILRLSYEQIQQLLAGIVHVSLSDGEIAHMLCNQAIAVHPAFEQLKESIRSQPGAHYDETGWPVQDGQQGNHAWVMAGTETPDAVFLLGRSRGKGNAEELKGDGGHVGVTDDYGAYTNLFACHQLCWSHPHRKLRELAESDTLSPKKRAHCQQVFESFAALYDDVQAVIQTPFNRADRMAQLPLLLGTFDEIAALHELDPKKLKAIKSRLCLRRDRYFTCMTNPGIPADNNKAERSLRHLVLKRKSSFGSRTQKGADLMSVLYSVLLSLWWRSKQTFFQNYAALLDTS